MPKEDGSKSASTPSLADLKKAGEQLHIPQTIPTAIAKTKGIENLSLGEIAAEKAASVQTDVAAKKEDSKKLTLGQKIKKELLHYWDGTKLLATEVRISSKLALKMAAGYELSRRENRQVSRLQSTLTPSTLILM